MVLRSEQLTIAQERIARYLSWVFGWHVTVLNVSALPGHIHENLHVRVLVGGEEKDLVIRRQPAQDLGFARQVSPYDLQLEFLALSDLAETVLPVPQVWGLDLDGHHLGFPAFVMEYIHGRTVLEAVRDHPDGLVPAFADTILAMNRIQPCEVPNLVENRGEPADRPVDLLDWLRRQGEQCNAPDFFWTALRRLEREQPEDRPCPAFGNGDLGPQNFVVAEDAAIAILDWEYVGFNDPLAELMLLHVWPIEAPFLTRYPLDRLYCELAGLDVALLKWYEVYGALSGWMFGIMDQDVQWLDIHNRRLADLGLL